MPMVVLVLEQIHMFQASNDCVTPAQKAVQVSLDAAVTDCFQSSFEIMVIIKNLGFRNVRKPLALGFYVAQGKIVMFCNRKKLIALIQDCIYCEPCVE